MKRKKLWIAIAGVALAAGIAAVGAHQWKQARIEAFHDQFRGTWYRREESILPTLKISGDEIVYRVETGMSWLNPELARFDYEVIDRGEVQVDFFGEERVYEVRIGESGDSMTFVPALTSGDERERWTRK